MASRSRKTSPAADPPPAGDRFEQVLLDAERLLGVSITIHDRAEIFRDGDGLPLLPSARRYHHHPYCALDRYRVDGFDRSCVAHCRDAVNATVFARRAAYVHRCWKGAQEVAVPVMRGEIHVATMFAGPFRHPDGVGAPRAGVLPDAVVAAYRLLPVGDARRLDAVGRILTTLGQGLLNHLDDLHLLQDSDGSRRTEIRRFLSYRSHQAVGLDDLATELGLSSSRASHLVQEIFGQSFTELMLHERMSRARMLLVSSSYSAGQIAQRVGIPDEYYFNRAFKRRFGLPPGRYRRAHRRPGSERSVTG
ncbi:MAG: helix-turn-helix domain-containing protein [Planctomycetes bacterium]|nr:helix-turn-helix domain-containing protein [Planctomycetota bacterium]